MSGPASINKNSVRVCVVGGGSIGSLHVELHAARSGANKIGVVEIDDSLRVGYEKNGIKTHRNLEDALKEGYDVYDICLPTFLHITSITHILDNTDAKIICEKPIVLNYDEFLQLESYGEQVEERLVGAFVERFNEPFVLAKKWIDQKTGSFSMEFVRRTKKPIRQDWVKDSSKGGSVLLDLGIHDIDASLWFSGAEYHSIISRDSSADHESLVVKLKDGTTVSYKVGWDIPQDSEVGLINSFRINSGESQFIYESANETVIIENNEISVTPRFPSAYDLELEAAMNLNEYVDPRYPTYKEMKQVYVLLKDLEGKE